MWIKGFLIPLSLFLFFACIYFLNLSRSVYAGDVGDLITAAYVFGVPHPPGYPLFSLLGYFFSHAFPLSSVAFRVGSISAISSALGVVFFYYAINKVTKNALISLLTACILGLNYLYWFYAEIAEVFALNNFFVCLLLYLGISCYESKKKIYFFLLSFCFGLALTNHHTILLLFPSLVILSFSQVRNYITHDRKASIIAACLFLLGFSVYLYIPIASRTNPPVNWGNVTDLESFLHVLLRKDYGTFAAGAFPQSNFPQLLLIVKSYFLTIISQLTLPVVCFSLLGIVSSLKIRRKIALSVLLAFILSGPVFIAYARIPIHTSFLMGVYERFFIMSTILLLFFFPLGLLFVIKTITPYFRKESLIAIQGVFFIIPILLFFYNFPKTNLSKVYIGDNLGKDMLAFLPKNAVLGISSDTKLFNTWYMHYVVGMRKDVTIINLGNMTSSSYFAALTSKYKKEHPEITDRKKIARETMLAITQKRLIFSSDPLMLSEQYIWIPYGITYQLVKAGKKPTKKEYITLSNTIWNSLHIPQRSEKEVALGSLTISDIPTIYANALIEAGNFILSEYQDSKTAERYFDMAKTTDGTNPRVYTAWGKYYYIEKKDCKNAEKAFEKSISLSPLDKVNYFMLYSVALTCYQDSNRQKIIKTRYENTFGSSFITDLLEMKKDEGENAFQ